MSEIREITNSRNQQSVTSILFGVSVPTFFTTARNNARTTRRGLPGFMRVIFIFDQRVCFK